MRASTGYGLDALSYFEARYLVKQNNAESVRNRILAAGSERVDGGNRGLPQAFARNEGAAALAAQQPPPSSRFTPRGHPAPAGGGHLSWSGSGGPAHQFWCGRDRRPHLCGGLLALLLRSATSPANTGLRNSGRNGFNRQRCRLMARPVPSPFLGVQAAARACRPLAGGVVLLRPFTSASRHQGTCPK